MNETETKQVEGAQIKNDNANNRRNCNSLMQPYKTDIFLTSLFLLGISGVIIGSIMVNNYNNYTGPRLDDSIKGTCTVTGTHVMKIDLYWTLIYNVTVKFEDDDNYLQILQPKSNKKTAQASKDDDKIKTATCWFNKTEKGTYNNGTWEFIGSSTQGWGIFFISIGCTIVCMVPIIADAHAEWEIQKKIAMSV